MCVLGGGGRVALTVSGINAHLRAAGAPAVARAPGQVLCWYWAVWVGWVVARVPGCRGRRREAESQGQIQRGRESGVEEEKRGRATRGMQHEGGAEGRAGIAKEGQGLETRQGSPAGTWQLVGQAGVGHAVQSEAGG